MSTPVVPPQLAPARGYSHGMVSAQGARLLAVAGQIGWDGAGQLVSADFAEQFAQALANVVAVVRQAGGAPTDVLSLRIYVTDKRQYSDALKPVGAAYRALFGRHYPAMALVQVADLLEPGALVEIEALAGLGGAEQ